MSEAGRESGVRHWRIRSVLQLLVLACLLPVIAGGTLLFALEYRNERELLRNDLISRARAMLQTVDAQLASAIAVARTLASFDDLIAGDLAGFHARARVVLEQTGIGTNVVLTGRDGQQVLNTLRPPGDLLPFSANSELLHQVFAGTAGVISPLYTGAVLQQPVFSVDVPVRGAGGVSHALSLGILPARFNDVLSSQAFPPDWVAVVFDNTGTIVARTHSPETLVGTKGTPEYIRNIGLVPEGFMQTTTVEGIPVSSVWSRSPVTGWSVGIGIPDASLERGLVRRMAWLLAGFGTLVMASLLLAWLVGRRIAAAVQSLKAPALALASGQQVPQPDLHIEEAAQVAASIREASTRLQQHQQELEQAQRISREELEVMVARRTGDLLEANGKLELLANTDVLTGLRNRSYADIRLRQEYLRFKRSGKPYTILYLDVDHFKRVNDQFGHETGDHVLQRLAFLLKAGIRESDLVSRYGGEEFLMQLVETDLAGAEVLAERLRKRIAAEAFPLVGELTVSIGLGAVAADDDNEEAAVRRADAALYRAKAEGRNRVCRG